MSTVSSWFDVDRKGLKQLVDGRSKEFILFPVHDRFETAADYMRNFD